MAAAFTLTSLPRAGALALLPLAILVVVGLMVVPIPALLLDIFFVSSILLSLLTLMVVLSARRPLDFSSFPTVLLFATLFRLALNVASTRVILVKAHESTDAAGHVIEAFGKALIGGDFVVGLIVFSILMIVNLAVIAKGAGRVSEVSARFTLDALPGKQMAIDADLNAGMLTPDEARARRREVAEEADFYGSMDGASKFVKGDAVAGILILFINIIGGIIIGMASHGMTAGEAADRYLLLSVGDALVAQVPALLLSIAAAILVTRSTDASGLSSQLVRQFAAPSAWWPVAGILGLLGLAPGMPAVVLLPAAAVAGVTAWHLQRAAAITPEAPAPPLPVRAADDPHIDWSEVGEGTLVNLEIGYGLIALVDAADGVALMTRVTAIRRQLSRELGFVMPLVRVRDDLGLGPNAYRVLIAGEVVGEGEAWPADLLALEAESVSADIPGRHTQDPAFGIPARWIDPKREQEALAAGYTVVDPATVIGTHLHKLMRERAHLLFGQDEMHALTETLATRHPQLAQSVRPPVLPLAVATSVCRMLVEEGLSLREFPRIAGVLGQFAASSADPAELVEMIRPDLGGLIVSGFAGPGQPLKLIAMAPALEQLLGAAHRTAPRAAYPFEPELAARLVKAIADAAEGPRSNGEAVALVSQPGPRRALWRLLRGSGSPLTVLAFTELPDTRTVDVIAVVGDGITEPHQERES